MAVRPQDQFTLERGSAPHLPREVRLSATGGMDIVASAELAPVIREHLAAGSRVVVDLSEVTFMDSSGVAAIVMSPADAEERSRLTVIPSRHRQPQRLARMTGLAAMTRPQR
jgi:anti-anti-sigma factor